MPTFEDMKRMIPSRRSQSPGEPTRRSQSPSKTSLLRERIQSKLKRSSSDITPSPKKEEEAKSSQEKKGGSFGKGAARLLHTVRSKTSSGIPIRRSHSPAAEKLKQSSPELTSPTEVKRALLETTGDKGERHKLSVKLEVVKNATVKKLKGGGTGEKAGKVKGSKKPGKSVKISNGAPSKPPRKLNNGTWEEVTPLPSGRTPSAASIRHQSCLSPSGSRPTSPQTPGSSTPSRRSPPGSKIPVLSNGKGSKDKISRAKSAAALASIKELHREIIKGRRTISPSPGPRSHPHYFSKEDLIDDDVRSFSSLPALTPYLRETKRVSRSAYRTKAEVRPNRASTLREKIICDSEKGTLERKKDKGSPTLRRSVSCLTEGEKSLRDYCYSKYILELQHSRRRSPRFLQLHRLYSSLERLGQLEASTSEFDVSVMSPERQRDFDQWWKLRNTSRVQGEMESISRELEEAQNNKEFFYRPVNPGNLRWRGDSGLRIKKWSIEELRNLLQLTSGEGSGPIWLQNAQEKNTEKTRSSKDVHKALWRGSSVKEAALNMEVNALNKAEGGGGVRFSECFYRHPSLRRAFSMSSTLSLNQREAIKGQLGSLLTKPVGENTYGSLPSKSKARSAASAPRVLTTRMGNIPPALRRTESDRIIGSDGGLTENYKRALSRTLSQEFRDKKSKGETPHGSMPISSQLLLQKQAARGEPKNKRIPYSYYNAKGVPTKVHFFENKENSRPGSAVKSSDPKLKCPSPTLSRIRSRSASPVLGIKGEYMSHVNVINKLAALLLKGDSSLKSLLQKEIWEREKVERLRVANSGEVDRLKNYFENEAEIALLRTLFCSDPDLAGSVNKMASGYGLNLGRSASADLFKNKDNTRWKLTRPELEGRESSPIFNRSFKGSQGPLRTSSPELLFHSRCRKPIYAPSSTPNVCPPTLTAHCYLESPGGKSSLQDLTADSLYNSSDYTGGLYGGSPSLSMSMTSVPSPSPPYPFSHFPCGRPVRTLRNYDPSLHRPQFRYVPPLPPQRENIPPIPPRPIFQAYSPYYGGPNLNSLRSNSMRSVGARGGGASGRVQLVRPGPSYPSVVRSHSLNPQRPLQLTNTNVQHHYCTYKPGRVPHSSSPSVRYAESDVNIHYKAPVRLEEKRYIPPDVLRREQEAAMRRFYQEQRHRKYLQEIQDLENRRHTDNFTPSQKSPIPLNRYENFIDDKPGWIRDKTPERKMVAKALYSFSAQNSRELSFLKGDILYIRRQLDPNWFEGEHNAAIGIFPTSYVQIIPSYEATERATPRVPTEGQAKVRFTFNAATPAEMSIVKGETIVLCRRVDSNWFEGRIGSRRGIFPSSYVQVLKEPGSDLNSTFSPKPVGSPAAHSLITDPSRSSQHPQHKYRPTDYDTKSIIAEINNDFQTFTNSGFLRRSPPKQTPNGRTYRPDQSLSIDTRSEPPLYRALYNYIPQHEDELELRENDMVQVLEQCDDGWFVGTSQRTGIFGTFPGNYVSRVF